MKTIRHLSRMACFAMIFFVGLAVCAPAGPQGIDIKSVNGVATYPDKYQGTPHRDAGSDPFLSPTNSALILIDYQPHILSGVTSLDHETLLFNTEALIQSAVHFKMPIIFSHVGVGLSGSKPFFKRLLRIAPDAIVIDRTNVNAWEEKEFVEAVRNTGRKKLIMGGLWTDVCLAYPAIEATREGFEVFVPEDTVGSITELSHENGMKRMVQAGVIPVTWNVVLAELQRDHARSATAGGVSAVFLKYLFKRDSW